MLLYYADEAKLYVPVERLDLVQRYSSAEGISHNSIDSAVSAGKRRRQSAAPCATWPTSCCVSTRNENSSAVTRSLPTRPGNRSLKTAFRLFSPSRPGTAIEDVKKDMEEPVPMDRLLCGDVGYGKTEVAMRAAFKSVMEGKQAAILTPTTVLAYQHYDTFRNRFAPFPVKVELLSRFRSSKEQKEVEEGRVG